MKPVNTSPSKQTGPQRTWKRPLNISEQRVRLKELNTKRQRIGLSVTAGHVRGGHSFH